MGKSQLKQIETLTLPRLELNAVIIVVKLYNIIHKIDLPIEKTWSDPMLTLQYVQDKSNHFKIFVANL